jgi:hypothetical protein
MKTGRVKKTKKLFKREQMLQENSVRQEERKQDLETSLHAPARTWTDLPLRGAVRKFRFPK